MSATVVLVHGAWHGSWVWERVVAGLGTRGHEARAVDLPSSSDDAAARGDLAADVAALRGVLDEVDGPAVLVGHSYGGIPITVAADGRRDVAHLVYVAAFQLDVGESLVGSLGGSLAPWIEVLEDGAATFPQDAERAFYGDVDDTTARDAVARLTRQSLASFTDEVTAAAWHDVPSTYILTERDRSIPPAAQARMARRAGTVHRLDTAHSPFLSAADEVVALLAAVADAA